MPPRGRGREGDCSPIHSSKCWLHTPSRSRNWAASHESLTEARCFILNLMRLLEAGQVSRDLWRSLVESRHL